MSITLPAINNPTGSYSGYLVRVQSTANTDRINIQPTPTLTQVISNPTSGIGIPLPPGWDTISEVEIDGRYLPLIDPEPTGFEGFVYNPYLREVRVIFFGEARSLIIYGEPESIKYAPPYLPEPYPLLFTQLPLQGAIQLNRQFEGQPGGSFELESTLPKSQLQTLLSPGIEIEVYGLPLRINNISITELPRSIYPDGRVKLSGTFGSKWENYLDEPVFLRKDGKTNYTDSTPFRDTECINPQGNLYQKDPNNQVTVNELFRRAKMELTGVGLKTVPIPPETLQDATINPAQQLNERLRLANSFVRWSSPAVEVVPINGLKVWRYGEEEILTDVQTTYGGATKLNRTPLNFANLQPLKPLTPDFSNFPSTITPTPTPTLINAPTVRGFEYPNVEVSGDFKTLKRDRREITQGQTPRFVRKPRDRRTRVDGDENANQFPDGTTAIKTLSMCFDNGGETRSRQFVTEEDGVEVQVVSETWGFVFYADQIYDLNSPEYINGNPGAYWQIIRKTTTEFIYDENTGYLTKVLESGFQVVRWRKESASPFPDTLILNPTGAEYSLYQFFTIPIVKRTSYSLKLLPEQVLSEGLYEIVKRCNKDGSSTPEVLINPDYAPKYYVERSRTESSGFSWRDNPANEGLDPNTDKLAPPLTVGEESKFETRVTIIPAKYREYIVSSDNNIPVVLRGEEVTPQRYVKNTTKFSASGQDMTEAIAEENVENGTGEPPLGQKRPPQYKLEKQPDSVLDAYYAWLDRDEKKYRYFVQTPGYQVTDPIGGSESFPLARTWEEAQIALKAKLNIENWRTGLQESFTIRGNLQIKEGDRFTYTCNGEIRDRVVLNVSHSIEILGVLDDTPRSTIVTSLTLGQYYDPPLNFTFSQVDEPRDLLNILTFNPIDQRIGGILPWANIRSRRNF